MTIESNDLSLPIVPPETDQAPIVKQRSKPLPREVILQRAETVEAISKEQEQQQHEFLQRVAMGEI